MTRGPRLIGFAASVSPSLFPCPCETHPSRPSTRRFAPGFTLRASSPLQSAFAITSAPPFRARRLPGFLPSSRHHSSASTSREGSRGPAPFRPQAFAASRRFTPRSSFEACFILEPCSGTLCRSGASLSAQRSALVERRFPLAVDRPGARVGSRDPPSTPGRPRLRGFPSTRRRVRTGSVLSLTGGRSPLRVATPPGTLRSGWGCEFLAAHRS